MGAEAQKATCAPCLAEAVPAFAPALARSAEPIYALVPWGGDTKGREAMIPESTLKRLKDSDPIKRCKAMDSVAKKAHPDAVACLIEKLGDTAGAVRVHARRLLKQVTKVDLGASRSEWTRWWQMYASRACRVCGRWLFAHKLYYAVKTDITAEPREIVLNEEDLAKDHQAEIDRLCRELCATYKEEAQDEVWVRLEYFLCTACKKKFVREMR